MKDHVQTQDDCLERGDEQEEEKKINRAVIAAWCPLEPEATSTSVPEEKAEKITPHPYPDELESPRTHKVTCHFSTTPTTSVALPPLLIPQVCFSMVKGNATAPPLQPVIPAQ